MYAYRVEISLENTSITKIICIFIRLALLHYLNNLIIKDLTLGYLFKKFNIKFLSLKFKITKNLSILINRLQLFVNKDLIVIVYIYIR